MKLQLKPSFVTVTGTVTAVQKQINNGLKATYAPLPLMLPTPARPTALAAAVSLFISAAVFAQTPTAPAPATAPTPVTTQPVTELKTTTELNTAAPKPANAEPVATPAPASAPASALAPTTAPTTTPTTAPKAAPRATATPTTATTAKAVSAPAAKPVSTDAPDWLVKELNKPLRLQGEGLLRIFGFRIYNARLWVPGEAFNFNADFALDITYMQGTDKQGLVLATVPELGRFMVVNSGKLEGWTTDLRRVYPDIEAGHRLMAMWMKDKNVTRFFHNEKPTGDIVGADFAKAFFSIWLDPQTRRPELRRALLSEKETRK